METTVTGQSQKAQLNLWFNYHIYSHVSTFLSAQIYFKTSSFYRFIFFTLKNINCLSLTHSCTPPFYAHVIRIWKFFYIKISEIFIFFYWGGQFLKHVCLKINQNKSGMHNLNTHILLIFSFASGELKLHFAICFVSYAVCSELTFLCNDSFLKYWYTTPREAKTWTFPTFSCHKTGFWKCFYFQFYFCDYR